MKLLAKLIKKQNKKPTGALPSPIDQRDYQIHNLIAGAGSEELPSEYINPLSKTIKVLDQGLSSECVACSLSYLRYLTEYNQSNNRNYFSPTYIYANRRPTDYQGEGMYPREALRQLVKCGACYEESLPGFYDIKTAKQKYNANKAAYDAEAKPFRVTSYYAASTVLDIKKAIYNLGGVTANFPVFQCLYNAEKTGNVKYNIDNPGAIDSYHEMTIVGWTKDKWIVLNSWGESWGDAGFCYVPFEYPLVEVWAIVDEITEKKFTSQIANSFSDIQNHWAKENIEKADRKGIINGFDDGTFRPDEPVTRAQLCAILDRLNLFN